MKYLRNGTGPVAIIVVDFAGARVHGDVQTLLGSNGGHWDLDFPVYELEPPMKILSPDVLLNGWTETVLALGLPCVLLTFCSGAQLGEALAERIANKGLLVAGIIHLDPAEVTLSTFLEELRILVRQPEMYERRFASIGAALEFSLVDDNVMPTLLQELDGLLTYAGEHVARGAGVEWDDFGWVLSRWVGWTSFLLASCLSQKIDIPKRPLSRHRILAEDKKSGLHSSNDHFLGLQHEDMLRDAATLHALRECVVELVSTILPTG